MYLTHSNSIYIYIVKPNATEEEINQIIDSDHQNQVFAQSVSTY